MAVNKYRRRVAVDTSITIRGNKTGVTPSAMVGLINSYGGGTISNAVAAGTLALTINGTAPAGTVGLLDLSANRLRIPSAGRSIGGNTIGFGTSSPTLNGSAGDIATGFTGASAQLLLNIGGTAYVLQWATAGSTVFAYPYAPGVA